MNDPIRSRSWLVTTLIFLILTLPQGLIAAPPSGGGGGTKVSVTAANPSEALQGEELDVTVTGSGFDSGSQVSYLVTGTTDASQVEVLSVQFISSTELRTRIRPKDAALPSEYDIEVRTLSGRKGKGTTLFSVKVAETACTGFESKEPEIAYLTALDTSGEIHTQDLYLSTASGCDQYLLLENALQKLPDGSPSDGPGEYLEDVTDLRLDMEGNLGVVSWRDTAQEPSPQMGLTFTFDSLGNVFPELGGPRNFYSSPSGADVRGADVRINDQGQIELVLVERAADESEWLISLFNTDNAAYSILSAGNCHAQSVSGHCFVQQLGRINWNDDGSQIFFEPENPLYVGQAIARLQRLNGLWQPAEILMVHTQALQVVGVSSTGRLAYEYIGQQTSKRGKVVSSQWFTAVFDPDLCEVIECVPSDGLLLPVDSTKFPRGWTRSGGLLFIETGPGSQRNIKEYSNPYTGEIGSLNIPNVDASERDTSF